MNALRENSLRQGLAALQQRRQRRKVTSILAGAVAAALLLAVSLRRNHAEPSTNFVTPAAPSTKLGQIEVINDEQLLALFSDRSVALVSGTAGQQLLFLDAPERETTRSALR